MATSGTTVVGAFDPLKEIADVCERHGIWLHIDVSGIFQPGVAVELWADLLLASNPTLKSISTCSSPHFGTVPADFECLTDHTTIKHYFVNNETCILF